MIGSPIPKREEHAIYREMRRADPIDGFADEPDWHDDPAPRRALTVTLCLVIACAIIGGAAGWMIL